MFKIRTPLFEGETGTGAGGGDAGASTAASTLLSGGGEQSQNTAPAPQQNATNDEGESIPFDFTKALDEKGGFRPGWHDTLPPELKDYSGILSRYPNPIEALRALGESRKLISQRQESNKPPGEGAKPEEVAAWRKHIGVPETPEGYNVKAPEKLPEGVTWNDAEAGEFAKFAHEINLTPQQVNRLLEYEIKNRETMWQTGNAKLTEYTQQQAAALKNEWGAEFDANISKAKHTAQLLGVDINDPALGNNPAFVKAMAQASSLISEDKLVGSGRGGSVMGGQQQADDILNNPNNPWHNAYWGREGEGRQKEAQSHRLGLLGRKF